MASKLWNLGLRKEWILPAGFSWMFVIVIDLTLVAIGAISIFQRPAVDRPTACAAIAAALAPWLLFFLLDVAKFQAPILWAAWVSATATLLFATTTPVPGDFAPLLLTLNVGTVSAITLTAGGLMAAVSAEALIIIAAALHRLETPALYLMFVGIGWIVGYLMRRQQALLVEQRQLHGQLAAHAAADERRRIAREVHDVIAHSLSITLLHLTGARHALEYSDCGNKAVEPLRQAERLGRQAMADIRRTVGLLDPRGSGVAPEPTLADIAALADDFKRAGLKLSITIDGDLSHASAAAGLALYRIAQESLANIAKHAPESSAAITVRSSRRATQLVVVNELPQQPAACAAPDGRGLQGMRQRVELLGGTIAIDRGPTCWSVQATLLCDANGVRPPTPASPS
ncbi:sensor histidine kinase [Mycobacterium sp. 1245852.3]|uniref:sensor histidine kinase n=1 Tax=Mycobacterium sp. 1245852.3 TaxID=1856860 RepID=UPI001E58B135|nr:histidine kinase [Mycobacterium sp. 1245852.3]